MLNISFVNSRPYIDNYILLWSEDIVGDIFTLGIIFILVNEFYDIFCLVGKSMICFLKIIFPSSSRDSAGFCSFCVIPEFILA